MMLKLNTNFKTACNAAFGTCTTYYFSTIFSRLINKEDLNSQFIMIGGFGSANLNVGTLMLIS